MTFNHAQILHHCDIENWLMFLKTNIFLYHLMNRSKDWAVFMIQMNNTNIIDILLKRSQHLLCYC